MTLLIPCGKHILAVLAVNELLEIVIHGSEQLYVVRRESVMSKEAVERDSFAQTLAVLGIEIQKRSVLDEPYRYREISHPLVVNAPYLVAVRQEVIKIRIDICNRIRVFTFSRTKITEYGCELVGLYEVSCRLLECEYLIKSLIYLRIEALLIQMLKIKVAQQFGSVDKREHNSRIPLLAGDRFNIGIQILEQSIFVCDKSNICFGSCIHRLLDNFELTSVLHDLSTDPVVRSSERIVFYIEKLAHDHSPLSANTRNEFAKYSYIPSLMSVSVALASLKSTTLSLS